MQYNDQTNMGGTGEVFLATHWSLIHDVNQGNDRDRALIGLLLQRYWKPVYCFLRHKGYPNEEAKDLTQDFFHDVVLNRDLVSRADPTQGRFRTFLLHALDQFLIDCQRKESAKKRIPREKLVSMDDIDPLTLPQTLGQGSAEDSFNYTWKSSLLDQTLATLQADCHEQGLQVHWRVFEARVLQPILKNEEAPSLPSVCARYRIRNESTASNMLVTVKRRFKAVLRRNLRNTVLSEDDVNGELKDMLSFFSSGGQDQDPTSGQLQ
jgi:DNA-directed RNA polymerase specialized sigma24 family protein